jgi:hypothetical protein
MVVPVLSCPIGKSEVFVDSFLPVAINLMDNACHISAAAPLAVHAVGCQISPHKPIPHDDLFSFTKLKAEAAMSKTKLALGCLINTRSLVITLPENKFLGWTTSISEVMSLTYADAGTLETLL